MWLARRRTPHRRSRRLLRAERLEDRRMLVAEGDIFALTRTIDAADMAGTLTATVDWGDGSTSNAEVQGGQAVNQLSARIDYSLDASNFFTSARRQLLQAAVDSVVGRFSDTLTAIQPGGDNSWRAVFPNPATGQTVERSNLQIAQNEILIFAGARSLPGSQLGSGGPGGFSASGSSTFLNNLRTRGQQNVEGATASDFGPWGGAITFDSTADWYFGTDEAGLPAGKADFLTTAVHEAMHLLGFGTAASWQRLASSTGFAGAKARAAYDGSGNVPLASDLSHWQRDLVDEDRETIMDPDQTTGTRKTATPLDLAALDDIGWEIPSTLARVTASHVYPDDGSYPVEVTLIGSRLGQRTDSLTARVTNLPPTVDVAADQTVQAGTLLTITDLASISDPGFRNLLAVPPTAETFTYSIDWGDGSAAQTGAATIDQIGNATRPTLASLNGSHRYTAAGSFTARVTVTDDDGGSAQGSFKVFVGAPPELTIETNRTRIAEDGSIGATLTIRRSGGDMSAPLDIDLASDDTSEATVAASATFAANVATITVPVTAVDDTLLDGDQAVRITASATGVDPVAVDLVVADRESLAALFLDPTTSEGAGANAVRLRVTRSNTDTANPLEVTVTGGDDTELEPLTRVTIPAGSQSVVVRLDAIDDLSPDRTQTVQLSFSASGYAGATASVEVLDDEHPFFQNPSKPWDVNNDGLVRPLDALQIINFLNRQGGPRSLDPDRDPAPPYYDVNGDYEVTPLDALRIINAINRGIT